MPYRNPVQSDQCQDANVQQTFFNPDLQQESAPIRLPMPYRNPVPSDQDANIQQTSNLQQEPPHSQPPKVSSQIKKPVVIQAFGSKRQGVTQLQVIQASPTPGSFTLEGWLIQFTYKLPTILVN
jgi:hypothetical protein